MKDRIELRDVVLLGRTFSEYCRYFELNDTQLADGTILDLGAGIGSFCAEANSRGIAVTAADPVYGFPLERIAAKSERDLKNVLRQLPRVLHKYVWTWYKDTDDLAEHRWEARRRFLDDFKRNPGRYIEAALPETGFQDRQFSMVLVSHFLFLYDDLFDYEFHRASVLEAMRIADREVRIYPLVNMRTDKSVYLDKLTHDPKCAGLQFTVREIKFEFFKNANELLIIRRA